MMGEFRQVEGIAGEDLCWAAAVWACGRVTGWLGVGAGGSTVVAERVDLPSLWQVCRECVPWWWWPLCAEWRPSRGLLVNP